MNSSFNFASEKFVGPIEVLLGLVRKRKVHISELALLEVADSFLAHFRSVPEMSLHYATHFLSVATTLVYVKSKALFPEVELDQDAEEALTVLVDRMKMFSIIENQIPKLKKQEPMALCNWRPVKSIGFKTDPNLTCYSINQKITDVLRRETKPVATAGEEVVKKIKPRLALSMVFKKLNSHLVLQGKFLLSDFMSQIWEDLDDSFDKKDASIGGFLATLEMIRRREARCNQSGVFEGIMVTVVE